jgi:hypothetical protein
MPVTPVPPNRGDGLGRPRWDGAGCSCEGRKKSPLPVHGSKVGAPFARAGAPSLRTPALAARSRATWTETRRDMESSKKRKKK